LPVKVTAVKRIFPQILWTLIMRTQDFVIHQCHGNLGNHSMAPFHSKACADS